MIADWLGCTFYVLTLVGCGVIWIANFALLAQLITYLALRRSGLALEQKRLASPIPADNELPDVVVQIPSFNEGPIVERGIANALKLDWPKHKLHIQVCDDSTDDTTAIARAAAARAVADGFDVQVIHRTNRKGFKAGSLQEAMTTTNYQYFAILDVDFISPPAFLRRCMAVLLSDPHIAFAQARMDFLNADTNVLTRAQALLLDQHYALEQPTRSWSGQALPFNGTCGVWRRQAIELGGGWRGETLTEDWELSYHARLQGMNGVFVSTVTAAGELPANWGSWATQQKRWAKGTGQVAWKMLPQIFTHRELSMRYRLTTFMPLAMWFLYAMFTATYLVMIPALFLVPFPRALLLALIVYLSYCGTFWIQAAVTWTASRAAGRKLSLRQFALDYLAVPFLGLYICWLHFWSAPAIVLGHEAVFVRTPKRGSSATAA